MQEMSTHRNFHRPKPHIGSGQSVMSLKVFVSSRIKNGELAEERNLARKTIEELKLEPIMWEFLPPSTSLDAEDAYLDGVRLCEVYVGIIGVEGSPASLREFEEAVKLDKKCFMFVKKVPQRQPGEDEFLEHARKSKCDEYSDPQEFSSQLEKMLLAFIAEQTLRRLETKGESRENVVHAYLEEYVRPVFDEVKEIALSLSDRRYVELPTNAWSSASRSEFFGTDASADQRLAEFYSRVHSLNDLRNAAIDDHRQNVVSAMEETFLETAQPLNEYVVVERLLNESFEFFLTRVDPYSELAKPLLNRLDGPLKSIAPEYWKIPYVSALWLVNRAFVRSHPPVLEEKGVLKGGRMATYLDAFGALHPVARRICEMLQEIYQGKIQGS